jgi:outer membrane protein TolC
VWPLAALLAVLAWPGPGRAADGSAPLRFGDAVKTAAMTTPTVVVASDKVAEAQARVGQARSALLPAIGGSALSTERTFNLESFGIEFPVAPGGTPLPNLQGPVGLVDARVKATQTLLDVSSIQHTRAAGHELRATASDRDRVAEQAARTTALAYLRAARAQAVADARAADARIARVLLTLAAAQRRAGTAPSIDETRARTAVATAQGESLIAVNEASLARIDLARTLGVSPASPPSLGDTLSDQLGASTVPPDVNAILPFALHHRPELAAEEARLAQVRAEHAAISSERIPRLDAMADWGVSGQQWSDAFPTYEYGLAVSWPLFDGLRRESRLSEQAAKQRESEVRQHDMTDQVGAEVQSAVLDLASGRERLVIAEERLGLALRELFEARDRFVNGVAGNIEIITAQASLVRARDAEIEARFAVASARVALAGAAGVAQSLH